MQKDKRVYLAVLVISIATVAAVVLGQFRILQLPSVAWRTDVSSIRELEYLPAGPVRLKGIVTYVDVTNRRFWLQDESGGISIPRDESATNLRTGQMVFVEARKTRPYDPVIGFASLGLTESRVTILQSGRTLPAPAAATATNFPEKDKSGVRISITGVLHHVTPDGNAGMILLFGESGQELRAIVPQSKQDLTPWINSTVRFTGVAEAQLDPGGSAATKYVWVASESDTQLLDRPHDPPPLVSVRTLYQTIRDDKGFRLRLRGQVVKGGQFDSLVVQDGWGAVTCRGDQHLSKFAPGTPVEVNGFPVLAGLRIDLTHIQVTEVPHFQAVSNQNGRTLSLTNISSVRRLTEEEADKALPVKLTGVITSNDEDWRQLFLQDSTGGIFVKYSTAPSSFSRGQEVTVTGLTNAGDFAPVIVGATVRTIGKSRLPKPIAMSSEAWSGSMDCLLAEVSGVVHPLAPHQNPQHLTFDLYTSFGPVHVMTGPGFADIGYLKKLEDSTVTVRGISTVIFNSRKQLIGLQLVVAQKTDVTVVATGSESPFAMPVISVNKLLRFTPGINFDHRVRVNGSVTMVGNGFLYVQDQTGGSRVEANTAGLRLDDYVDVAGYASAGGYSPMLTNALVEIRQHNVPMAVQKITSESMGDGKLDSQLVSIEGTVVRVVSSPDTATLVLRSGGRTFDAVLYVLNSNEVVRLPREGSGIRVTGIYSAQVGSSTVYLLLAKDRVGGKVIIRSAEDIRVLRPAPWWTLQRTVLVLAGIVLGLGVSLGWTRVLRRRVRQQSEALRKAKEKNDAVRELADAIQDVTHNKRFTSRVEVKGENEIALLSTEFNQMLHELQLREIAKSQAEAKLQQQALTDELTGLPNRRLLSDRLQQVLEMAKRDSRILGLLYIDLDGFKLVNDSLGHTVGDMLLGRVAERLRSRIRKSDTLARLGGDEFTVILTRLHAKEGAALVADTLLQVLAEPFSIENHEITIGASIGVSMFPENGADAVELLQQADSAMYAAKRNGKNRVMYFTPELGTSVRERLNLENQLRSALVKGEIHVYYQPEFDVATRRLVRFEALARWFHPTIGNIPPDKFIPIAEESGLIIPLGTFVLEQACREAATWQTVAESPVQVAVNVSTIQFRRESFVDEVATALRLSGLKPELLQIELTESIMLDGTERAANTMRRLSKMGVSIAVDDFGTGYSCFSYLPRLPFNTLKIDRTFVRELGRRPEMRAMIESLVTLAHNLNMQVVVEGIETHEQLHAIETLGGNEVQGFLLGRPTPDPKAVLASYGNIVNSVLSKHAAP